MSTRSYPPTELDPAPPAALASLDSGTFQHQARADGMIFFCVENAPRRACGTHAHADGSLTFQTSLCGRVKSVERDALVLDVGEQETRVRHHLPSGITLDSLADHVVSLELRQIYRSRGRATIDAVLSDAEGRMIFWVRDGHVPTDREAHGLSLRLTVDPQETRLAVRADTGILSLPCPGTRDFNAGGRDLTLALVRAGADDVSFALLRR